MFDSRDESNFMNFTQTHDNGAVSRINNIYFLVPFHDMNNKGSEGDIVNIFHIEPGRNDLEEYVEELTSNDNHPKKLGAVYQKIARIAINLVFYLNSSNREVGVTQRPDSRRIAELESELNNTRKSRERIRIKIEKKLEKLKNSVAITPIAPKFESKMSCEELELKSSGRKYREHWVSGFYNYYWCRNKDSEGNPIDGKHVESRWIKPYKRGSDLGKTVRNQYKVLDISEGK